MLCIKKTMVSSLRRIATSLTLITIICAGFAVSALAEVKIAYIRSEYIFSKYEPYREAQKQLDEFQKKELDTLQKMQDELQKKAQDASSKELLMTAEMKQQKLEELNKQREEIEKHYENLYKDDGVMVKKQTELLQPIIDRINEVLMRVAKAEEYDFILDATAGGQILFANEELDISDQILEELQKDISSQ